VTPHPKMILLRSLIVLPRFKYYMMCIYFEHHMDLINTQNFYHFMFQVKIGKYK
jgi:hypothetical protein